LFFVLLEVGMGGQLSFRHKKLLSVAAWIVRMSQAERRFAKLGEAGGGHCPFRGLDAPFALEKNVKGLAREVNFVRLRGSVGYAQWDACEDSSFWSLAGTAGRWGVA
jgi:hypothetical protein